MRLRTIAICAATALLATACGSSGSPAASRPTPPTPIVVSAFVTGQRVSLSPDRIGAGQVLLTVTNQARSAEALTISRSGRPGTLARTAPINPQGATQISVVLARGRYTVALAAGARRSEAQRSRATGAVSTTLRVGRTRSGGGDNVLTP